MLSLSSLQQLIVKQTVDIPVPGRAGGRRLGGLQGLPGHGLPGQDPQRFLEQIVLTFPVEVFKALAQSRVQQRPLRVLLTTLGNWFFALFPEGKSAKWSPHSGRN